MLNIWFDLCAVFILGIILVSFYTQKGSFLFQNKLFAALAWAVAVSTVCELLTGLWNNHNAYALEHFPLSLIYAVNYLYFIARNLCPFLYVYYIIAVLDLKKKFRFQSVLIYVPSMVTAILIALTPFFGFVFYIDEAGLYHRGVLLPVLYGIAFYHLVLAMIIIRNNRSVIPLSRRLALDSFVCLALGSVFMQLLFPSLLVECFGITLCILLLYLTIQKPEEILDTSTGFLNRTSFLTTLTVNHIQQMEVVAIPVIFEDFSFLVQSVGLITVMHFMSLVADYMSRLSKKARVYRIAQNQICILLNQDSFELADGIIASVTERFSKPWEVDGLSVLLPACLSRIAVPRDAATPEEVLNIIQILDAEPKAKRQAFISVADLDLKEKRRYKNIERIVREAFDKGMLEVVYQPIFSTELNRFNSAEALLRLKEPTLGYIPPDEFIPIAENNGAILQMGQFILDAACRFFAENDLARYGIEYIEVNLSAVECLQDNLVDNILLPIRKYGLNAEQLNLEITETAANTLPDSSVFHLNRLSKEGIRFSLDDYGTGYSNIARMLTLPFDLIKIDKSIVWAASESKSALTVLDSTVYMLQSLHKGTLAEGVETEEQARKLTGLGCDYIQGYYYSKPISGRDFLTLLQEKQAQYRAASLETAL